MPQKLEQYLDSLEKPLARLTPQERQEWRTEVAQHISSLAEAHTELGATEQEALEAAIAQFGDAKVVAHRLRQEAAYRRITFSPFQAITSALLVLILAQVAVLVFMGVLAAINIRAGWMLPYSALCVASFLLFLSGPILGGILLGRMLPRWRIVRDSFSTRTVIFFVLMILLELFWLTVLQGVLGAFAGSFTPGAPEIDFRFSLLCVPLTVLAALSGSRWASSQMRRRAITVEAGR